MSETEFDPATFEDKYVHYFEELQQAYSSAYNQLHGRYDSSILKAIDQRVERERTLLRRERGA